MNVILVSHHGRPLPHSQYAENEYAATGKVLHIALWRSVFEECSDGRPAPEPGSLSTVNVVEVAELVAGCSGTTRAERRRRPLDSINVGNRKTG